MHWIDLSEFTCRNAYKRYQRMSITCHPVLWKLGKTAHGRKSIESVLLLLYQAMVIPFVCIVNVKSTTHSSESLHLVWRDARSVYAQTMLQIAKVHVN